MSLSNGYSSDPTRWPAPSGPMKAEARKDETVAIAVRSGRLAEELREERRRIGRELHDTVCQEVTGIRLMAGRLLREIEERDPELAPRARCIVEELGRAGDQLREIARGIFSSPVEACGLGGALHQLAARVRAQHGIDCRFECEEPVEIAGQGRAAELLRIAQEAVTNAVRHSGASEIVIALKPAEDGWKLEVRDNGSAFSFEDGPRGGMGLQTMRDRADRIRASLHLAPPPVGPGTLVSCSFCAGGDHPTPEQSHMLTRSTGVDETRA